MTDETRPSMNDHDLLVILHTKLERVLVDLKEVKDNTVGRIAVLETTKLDKAEANMMLDTALKSAALVHDDQENRIRELEKGQSGLSLQLTKLATQIATWGTAGLIVLGVVQFLAGKFINF